MKPTLPTDNEQSIQMSCLHFWYMVSINLGLTFVYKINIAFYLSIVKCLNPEEKSRFKRVIILIKKTLL